MPTKKRRVVFDQSLLDEVLKINPALRGRPNSAIIDAALRCLIDSRRVYAPMVEVILKKHPHLAGLPERTLIEAGLLKLLDADPIPSSNLVQVPARPIGLRDLEQEARRLAGLEYQDLD